MASLLLLAAGLHIIYNFLNVYLFEYTAFAVNGKVEIPLTGLTIPV